jgi:hypothetical protein
MNNTDKLFNLILAFILFVVIVFCAGLVVESNKKLESIERKLESICEADRVECERQLTLLLLI